MNYRIIVHIGMHKTGSSSIQQALYNDLKDPNFKYAEFGSFNHSGVFFSLFSSNPEGIHKKSGLRREDIEKFNERKLNQFIKFAENCAAPNIIISGEAISILTFEGVENLRELLTRFSNRILIVGYVRPPRSYMESAFQQMVKVSLKNLDISDFYPNYRNRFEKFDKIFGRENVRLWKFDPESFPHRDIVADFCNRLSISLNTEDIRQHNVSISKEALALLIAFHKYGSGYGVGKYAVRIRDNLIETLSQIKGSKIRFSPSLFLPVLSTNQEDLLWMENRLPGSTAEDLEPSQNDIASETDLFEVSKETFLELGKIAELELDHVEVSRPRPHQVAQILEVLKERAFDQIRTYGSIEEAQGQEKILLKNKKKFQIGELINCIERRMPLVRNTTSEREIRKVIREALRQINNSLQLANRAILDIPDHGSIELTRKPMGKSDSSNLGGRFEVTLSNTTLQKGSTCIQAALEESESSSSETLKEELDNGLQPLMSRLTFHILRKQDVRMIPIDLIQSIKKNSPNTLKKFSEIKAARVIKELLVEIVRHTDSVHEGVVIFPKLGRFIIRQQETVQNDENTMTRKITFIRAKLEER